MNFGKLEIGPVQNASKIVIRPARNLAGAVQLPGDKSISHRYAMLAAIAQGTTTLQKLFPGRIAPAL